MSTKPTPGTVLRLLDVTPSDTIGMEMIEPYPKSAVEMMPCLGDDNVCFVAFDGDRKPILILQMVAEHATPQFVKRLRRWVERLDSNARTSMRLIKPSPSLSLPSRKRVRDASGAIPKE
jgi:hypothetical protein